MKPILLGALLCANVWGQLQFYAFDGTTETLITSNSYQAPGPFVVGVSQSIRIRTKNSSTQTACLVRISASLGAGFTLDPGNPGLPATLAPNLAAATDFKLNFLSQTPAKGASANFELQYALLSDPTKCTGPGATATSKTDLIITTGEIAAGAQIRLDPTGSAISSVPFGRVEIGKKSVIRLYVANPSSSTLTIPAGPQSQLDSNGVFTVVSAPAFPLTLNPSESAPLDLQFAPSAEKVYAGAVVLGALNLPLSGTGFAPPFPKPSIVVEPSLVSGVQSRLTITLPSPAPSSASGVLRLDFKPAAGTLDDQGVYIMPDQGRRSMAFNFAAGDTSATFGITKDLIFQTGTTTGTLTFSVTFQSVTSVATSVIPPQTVHIDSTISNRPNDSQLTVQLTGFDNSKTANQMAFTFYDTAGVQVPPGRIIYDAATDFSQFYTKSTAGGLFVLLAQFPVKGSTAKIASVDVELVNSAGTAKLTSLRF